MSWEYTSPEIYSPIFTPVPHEQIQRAARSAAFARLVRLADERCRNIHTDMV